MNRFEAMTEAMHSCSGDAHKLIGRLEQLGFDVIARSDPHGLGEVSRAVRRAVDAHSPLPRFSVPQIIAWVQENHGPMPRKQIYNGMAYMARRGEIEPLSRGVYRCCGNKPEEPPHD